MIEDEYNRTDTWSGMLDRAIRAAWRTMVTRLFRPFSAEYWFTLGFAAWLTALSGGGVSGILNGLNFLVRPSPAPRPGNAGDIQQILERWRRVVQWAQSHVLEVVFTAVLLMIVLLVVWLLLLWVSARGRFMFLEGVTSGTASVTASWRRWRDPANAAFVWLLLFRMLRGTVLTGSVFAGAGLVFMSSAGFSGISGALVVAAAFVGVVFVTFVCIGHFFEAFVLPLMYRYRIRAGAAWRLFLDILRPNWPGFLLYLAVVLFLRTAAALAILVAALATCCLGAVLVAIPYIGTVLLLPVTVYFRLLSLYFLQQFHRDFRFVPFPEETPELPTSSA